MILTVKNIDRTKKVATLNLNGEEVECPISLPKNKGMENSAWINIQELHPLLGKGEHKKWLTVNDCSTPNPKGYETLKQDPIPPYITLLNIKNFLTKEEYEQVAPILLQAELNLIAKKLSAGRILSDRENDLIAIAKLNERKSGN